MASFLLPIIYLAFISLGLPDSILGAAWPTMYQELGAGISWAGAITMIISAGTIVSSLSSDWLNSKIGTGRITALSVGLTAISLLGFSFCRSFLGLCLWAIPYGLGAGGVDAALNNYVALHYASRHMSWLHCMWGIGASAGPLIMSWALTRANWNTGYRIISVLQVALTVLLLFSLPLWKSPAQAAEEAGQEFTPQHRTLFQLLTLPGIKEVLLCFACYSAIESCAGMWAASYCTLARGISAATAANWASLFYIGITAGRFVCGFITMKFSDQNMIRIGQSIIVIGIALVILPSSATLLPGLVLIGCGCAPIYPSIIHETPANFGRELSMAITGIQMAFAYVGSCLLLPLFGVALQHLSPNLYPWLLAVILVLQIVMAEQLHRATATKRAQYYSK